MLRRTFPFSLVGLICLSASCTLPWKKVSVSFDFNTRCQPYTHHYFSCKYCIFWHSAWTYCACLSLTWHVDSCLTVVTFSYPPFLFFWAVSLSLMTGLNLLLSASWGLMVMPVLWFADFHGVLCAYCAIWLAFWETLQVWGGAGFHCYHKEKVRHRSNDRSYNLDESSCKGGRISGGK